MQTQYDGYQLGNQGAPPTSAPQQSMPQRNQPLVVLQGHRTGFLEQYIYTEQQLEQMKKRKSFLNLLIF